MAGRVAKSRVGFLKDKVTYQFFAVVNPATTR